MYKQEQFINWALREFQEEHVTVEIGKHQVLDIAVFDTKYAYKTSQAYVNVDNKKNLEHDSTSFKYGYPSGANNRGRPFDPNGLSLYCSSEGSFR